MTEGSPRAGYASGSIALLPADDRGHRALPGLPAPDGRKRRSERFVPYELGDGGPVQGATQAGIGAFEDQIRRRPGSLVEPPPAIETIMYRRTPRLMNGCDELRRGCAGRIVHVMGPVMVNEGLYTTIATVALTTVSLQGS